MYRNTKRGRSYAIGGTVPSYLGNGNISQMRASVIDVQQINTLSSHKNTILNSLTAYFSQKIDRDVLKTQLSQLKTKIQS
jgi:hypothetical protein